MSLMPVVFIAIVVLAVLSGVLRVVVPLLLGVAALRRQRAAMTASLPLVQNAALPNAPPLPPHSTGGNIYMPGGPAISGGQVFVPGMTHKWRR